MPKLVPPSCKERIIRLLSDGVPRNRNEIAHQLKMIPTVAYSTLIRMKDAGVIRQDTKNGHRDYKYELINYEMNANVWRKAERSLLEKHWTRAGEKFGGDHGAQA